MSQAAAWLLPSFIALTLGMALIRRVKVFDEFTEGAQEGVQLSLRLIPFIVGIYVAVGLFRETGALAGLTQLLSPVLSPLGFPADVVPLMIVRPFNNAAAMGIVTELFATNGTDSFVGRLASVMQGSSETTFYVLTVYLGSVGIRRSLYAAPLCLLGDLIGYLAALWATYLILA